MQDVVIVSAARTAIGRAPKGTLRTTRPDDLAAFTIRAAWERAGVEPEIIEDVILGCATPEAEQGLNVARIAAIRAGLPESIPGVTLNRFCASGLEAIATAAAKIATGQADVILAGGTESMSLVPFMGPSLSPNPTLMENQPNVYINMGPATEATAREFHVGREESDALAYDSHWKAIAAQDADRFDAEIVPVRIYVPDENNTPQEIEFAKDEGPRRETTPEILAKLKPAFGEDGIITAGNASPRSDGAAALLLMSASRAEQLKVKPMARFVGYATAALAPERFGIAPAYALPKLLQKHHLTLDDIGLIEFNEAFAAQRLAAERIFPLPTERVNVNGGAIALGHPLGATGARQATTLIYEGQRRGIRYGIVTMCAALGMGAAGLFEIL